MDRNSFLSSLPFLIPIASSSWPPRTTAPRSSNHSNSNGNGGNATTTAVRSERLLQDHYSLSIEPVARNRSDTSKAGAAATTTTNIGSATTTATAASTTLGPAFFGSSSLTTIDEFDPSLCSLEMVLEYTDNDHDNSNTNNNSNRGHQQHRNNSYSSPMQQTHRHGNSHNNNHRHQNYNATAAVSYTGMAYVSLHGSTIFQLDLSELQSVQVQETDATSSSSGMQPHAPPCLLLKFSNVAVLRIFSLVAVPADEHFHLQGVCHKITTAASAAAAASSQSQFSSMMTTLCDNNAVASPSAGTSRVGIGSCSTGSSTDTGFGGHYRHDVSGAAEGEHKARQEDGHEPSTTARSAQKRETHDDDEEENPRDRVERRIQRRRLAYDKSVAGMQALETVLDMPVSTFFADHPSAMTAQATASAVLMDRVSPLLTAIGDDLTNAYARQGDKAQAMQACESNLAECRNALDENLKAFFPLPRSKQRLLTTRTTTTVSSLAAARNSGNSKTDPGVDVDVIAEQVQELVQRQKEAVRKRHELFLLPSRG
jgi:hypothetical protein